MSRGYVPKISLNGRRTQIALLILGISLALVVPPASAQAPPPVPLQITYQGYLAASGGQPVTIPTTLTLRLYAAPTGGSPVWEETHADVPVTNGVFNVMLGSVTPLTVALFDTARYLAVQAGTDAEMTPRQALGASPFAIQSQVANQLAAGAPVPGSQITGTISSATIAGSQITGTISSATMPGVAPWVVVNGPSQQAISNIAYLVTGATPTTITLPASPAVGDVIKVSSQGGGGFTLVPSSGQTINGGHVVFGSGAWTPRESARNWWSVASSADGTKLVAVVYGGQIYTSADSGATWVPRESARNWWSVASSADGTKLVAVVYNGQLYTSADSGTTWTARESARNWFLVASSADGTKLVAAGDDGKLYTSADSGTTWTLCFGSTRRWQSVASSSDGTKLVAATMWEGMVYSSIYVGQNCAWSAVGFAEGSSAVASSADGTRLVAATSANQIYASTDGGKLWMARLGSGAASVASSADGTRLAAAVGNGQIYTSTDSGMIWTASESARDWRSVASSADGSKLVAVAYNDRIYTAAITSITGKQYAAAELVYAGNGQWMLVNQQGSLTTP